MFLNRRIGYSKDVVACRYSITHYKPLLKVNDQKVSLVHHSVRDYLLLRERNSNAVLEEFRLGIEPSHLELTQKYLGCIAQSSLRYSAISLLDPQESPLLPYAVLRWREHARTCFTLVAILFDHSALLFQKGSSLHIH